MAIHSGSESSLEEVMLVALSEVHTVDPVIGALSDLPCGWRAARTSTNAAWQREKHHPFPTFEEDGYYLEDAALYENLVELPDEADRERCREGDFAKLVFRFSAEDAPRQSLECERMWAIIDEVRDDGYYIGRLDNDPLQHDAIQSGDKVTFSRVHIIAVERSSDS